MARRYWKIPSSSFGVGQYPPRPSASPPDIGEGIAQPLRIWRIFSNTSSPCLGHCYITKFTRTMSLRIIPIFHFQLSKTIAACCFWKGTRHEMMFLFFLITEMNLYGKEPKIFLLSSSYLSNQRLLQKLFNLSDRIHFPIAKETGDSVGAKNAFWFI